MYLRICDKGVIYKQYVLLNEKLGYHFCRVVLLYVIADSYASRFTCVHVYVLQNETGFDGRIIKQGFLLKKVPTAVYAHG